MLVGIGVGESVGSGAGVGVSVGSGVMVGVGMGESVGAGVCVAVLVVIGALVGVGVSSGAVTVGAGVAVSVGVGMIVDDVGVGACVGVCDGSVSQAINKTDETSVARARMIGYLNSGIRVIFMPTFGSGRCFCKTLSLDVRCERGIKGLLRFKKAEIPRYARNDMGFRSE